MLVAVSLFEIAFVHRFVFQVASNEDGLLPHRGRGLGQLDTYAAAASVQVRVVREGRGLPQTDSPRRHVEQDPPTSQAQTADTQRWIDAQLEQAVLDEGAEGNEAGVSASPTVSSVVRGLSDHGQCGDD